MTEDEVREAVIAVLGEVAPEAQLDEIESNVSFHEQYDIDSVDFMNFVLGLEKRLGVGVPEVDYPRLSTLDGCIAYFTQKAAQASA
ncbi:MAG: acyl carrier protein [Gammaproteobacteria bacterium]|nr:acyl carrier protein [Gammaproteobacteria bacterium]NIR83542.1 acyl carrier protein [Gammaproteobacteria bacterium]NIR91464.1 acyl carrier protein [Gammaproteobacteria bacterium]NIU04704.1 acyl carrier protein [Gammaproteobacteria bacterium]NIV51746.1 acyl carrier protein [Gammaproteobacteria bacterium]